MPIATRASLPDSFWLAFSVTGASSSKQPVLGDDAEEEGERDRCHDQSGFRVLALGLVSLENRRARDRVIGRRGRQHGPVDRVGAFPLLLQRGRAAAQRREQV